MYLDRYSKMNKFEEEKIEQRGDKKIEILFDFKIDLFGNSN